MLVTLSAFTGFMKDILIICVNVIAKVSLQISIGMCIYLFEEMDPIPCVISADLMKIVLITVTSRKVGVWHCSMIALKIYGQKYARFFLMHR